MANHEVVNSRNFPLLLPIFNPVANETTVNDDLRIDQVLMIGGELSADDDQEVSPTYAKLSMVSNAWVWNTTQTEYNLSYDEIIGAATIFNTLVVINSTDSNSIKRDDDGYRLNLYDAETFKPVESLKLNTQNILLNPNAHSSSGDHHTTEKIVLGTILPIFAIVLGVIVFSTLEEEEENRNNWKKNNNNIMKLTTNMDTWHHQNLFPVLYIIN